MDRRPSELARYAFHLPAGWDIREALISRRRGRWIAVGELSARLVVKIDFSQVSRKRVSTWWNREAIVCVSMSVSAMSYPMADSIKDAIPNVLKTLWNLENELRGAAQNSVVLRRDEARKHLSEARRHLDELLGLARSSETTGPEGSRVSTEAPPSKPSGNQH